MKKALDYLISALVLGAVTTLALATAGALGQTLTLNDASTYSAHRLGMNFCGNNYYDCFTLKNLTAINPGFEGQQAAVTYIVAASPSPTNTTFTTTNGCDQAPPNFWASGTYRVLYSPVSGLTGATGTITANTGPNNDTGSCSGAPALTISALPGGAAPDAGDVIEAYQSGFNANCNFNQFGWICAGSGSGTAAVDTASGDQFPGSAGVQNIKFTLTSGSDSASVQTAIDTNPNAPNYFFSGTYTWCVKSKLASGSGINLTMSGNRSGAGFGCLFSSVASPAPGSSVANSCATFTCSEAAAQITAFSITSNVVTFTAANSFTSGTQVYIQKLATGTYLNGQTLTVLSSGLSSSQFEASFTHANVSSTADAGTASTAGPGYGMDLTVTASGAAGEVLIDDSSLTSNSDTNPSAFRDQIKTDMVTTMDVASMREWVGQNASNFANETASQFGRKSALANSGQNYTYQNNMLPGLYDFLEAAVDWGVPRVHYVVPMSDIWNIGEYVDFLAGTCGSSTGATARCNLGQTTPFTSLLSIELSGGNEVWNTSAQGQNIPYGPTGSEWYYGNIVSAMCATAKADANWNSSLSCDATLQTGGVPYYGTFTNVDLYDFNDYYPDFTITDAANPDQWVAEWTHQWAIANDCTSTGPEYCQAYNSHAFSLYEGQNSTGSTTGGQSSLNGFANGMGNGLIWTLGMGWLQEKFHPPQMNFFTLFQNFVNITGGMNYIWGSHTGGGGVWNNPRPTAQAIGVLNNCIGTGETGYEVTPSSIPTYNFAGYNGIPAESNVPLVQAFAYEPTSTTRCIAIWNVDSASHSLTIAGTNPPAGTCSTTTFTSTNLNDNNEAAMVVQPSTSSGACSTSVTVPKYSLTTISYSVGGAPPPPVLLSGQIARLRNVRIQ